MCRANKNQRCLLRSSKLNLKLHHKVLRTPVLVCVYPDICTANLTMPKNVGTRSRTVWLQTKMLTVFLVACLYTSRQISIAKLRMKATKEREFSMIMMISWLADELEELTTSSEVVPWGRSVVYVVSSRELAAMSVVMVEKNWSY